MENKDIKELIKEWIETVSYRGSCGRMWGFNECYPHEKYFVELDNILENLK